ncbi:MAG: DNA polymerase IV [Moraxellaceae bacterium]|nr:DNA polymerase IV [Moraxellaceae bacterium]
MIALVDMDAFFASVEQLDHPRLRGRPVGVVNGEQGSTLIAASYEARALGIRTGTRWLDARQRCPECVRIVARPARYAEVSARIMAALQEVTPDIEVFSVDEAFLDLTACQAYYRYRPEAIAALIRDTVYQASGLSCSVGLSGDKTTAKWAAKQQKPAGMTIITPDAAEARLAPVPLTELCGIGPGMAAFFEQFGVVHCGDMKKIPISMPARRFGNLGRRLWLMAQAKDPSPVSVQRRDPQSLSHGKILPPLTHDIDVIQGYLQHLAEKLAVRLRRHGYTVQDIHIGLRCPEGWRQGWLRTEQPTDDGLVIFQLCRRFLRQHWFGEVVQQVQLNASQPVRAGQQPDFFAAPAARSANSVMDSVNRQFGAFTLHRAGMHEHADSAPIISPAWARNGVREGMDAIMPGSKPKPR